MPEGLQDDRHQTQNPATENSSIQKEKNKQSLLKKNQKKKNYRNNPYYYPWSNKNKNNTNAYVRQYFSPFGQFQHPTPGVKTPNWQGTTGNAYT